MANEHMKRVLALLIIRKMYGYDTITYASNDQIKRSDTTKCGKYIVGTIIYKIDSQQNTMHKSSQTLLKTAARVWGKDSKEK